jgi:hypothetical protein
MVSLHLQGCWDGGEYVDGYYALFFTLHVRLRDVLGKSKSVGPEKIVGPLCVGVVE